jgi:hypothetical protein
LPAYLIGDEYDLALLAQRATERRNRFPDATAAGELELLIERRRAELQRLERRVRTDVGRRTVDVFRPA